MADEENESRAATMDLNLYLGLPRSPRPRNLDLGSDLSLSSLPLPASSDSSEGRAPEATSVAMEATASHVSHSPSHTFIAEADVPSAGPWPPVVENPIAPSPYYLAYEPYGHTCAQVENPISPSPYYLAYEPYGHTCAQETEEPSILFSPSNAQALQTEQVVVEPVERDRGYHTSFEEILGLHFVDDNSAQGDGSQTPYSPSYLPASAEFHDDVNIGAFLSHLSQNRSEPYSRAHGSSSQQDLLQCPEFRIRRLLESNGWRQSSLRQPLICGTERTTSVQHSSPSPEQLMLEIMSSQQSLDTNGKQKGPAEVLAADSSEKEAEEKNRCATNFDCNICLEIAKEPVVTSCGHLFCWPCLYQWLHVHSDRKECPICKGEVNEANLTPIYGRGCSRSDIKDKDDENSASGLSIPPRPHGNRLESWRQHFYPISRRVGESIANSWRRFLNYQIHNRSRFIGHEDPVMEEILSGSPAILTRSMTRRFQREQGITEGGTSTVERRFPRDGGSLPREPSTDSIHNEIDTGRGLYCFPANDSLAAMNSEIGRAVGRFSENNNFYGPSSSVNALNPGQFSSIPIVRARLSADQASASSTVAVISSENSARDASAEPNSAGSSMPYRRSWGSSSSGSSDDGGNLPARKRRRLR